MDNQTSSPVGLESGMSGGKKVGMIVGALVLLIAGGVVGYILGNGGSEPVATGTQTMSVALDEQFTLKKNQIAKVGDTGLEIVITDFHNSPCPAGSQCVWSGVGIGFEYRFNGQVERGIDLVKAFGFKTTIVKTDYEKYANLIVSQDSDGDGAGETFTDLMGHIKFEIPSGWFATTQPNYPGSIRLQPVGRVSSSLYESIDIDISGHCMNTQCLTVYTLEEMIQQLGSSGAPLTILGSAKAKNVSGYKVRQPAANGNPERIGYVFIKGPDFVSLYTDIYHKELERIIPTLELLTTKNFTDRFGE